MAVVFVVETGSAANERVEPNQIDAESARVHAKKIRVERMNVERIIGAIPENEGLRAGKSCKAKSEIKLHRAKPPAVEQTPRRWC